MRRFISFGFGVLALSACMKDTRDYEPPDLPPALLPSELASESSDVCRLLGPAQQSDGIYGTDLGYTVALPNGEGLAVLFGDTWSEAADAASTR